MSLTCMASFREARESEKLDRLKFWKRHGYRYIGGSVRTAQDHYYCHNCIEAICPGDQYLRDVFANYKYIRVKKYHWPQCHAPSEEEERELCEQLERERKSEHKKKLGRMAA